MAFSWTGSDTDASTIPEPTSMRTWPEVCSDVSWQLWHAERFALGSTCATA
jgi:hypothetical protein